MFSHDARPAQRLSQMMRRVLVVDAVEASAQATGELLFRLGRPDVWSAPTHAKALKLAAKVDPAVIVCAVSGEKLDGLRLTRELRRSDLACRKAPVVLVSGKADPGVLLAARDAGADELLARPFTLQDLQRRLETCLLSPSDWVEAMDYVGPDRRRFNAGALAEGKRRQADFPSAPESVRIGQALKILRAALSSFEADPGQARRAMLAQSEILQGSAGESGDSALAAASLTLRGYLADRMGPAIDRAELQARAAAVLAFLPREDARAA